MTLYLPPGAIQPRLSFLFIYQPHKKILSLTPNFLGLNIKPNVSNQTNDREQEKLILGQQTRKSKDQNLTVTDPSPQPKSHKRTN